jgi:hypothetical protein
MNTFSKTKTISLTSLLALVALFSFTLAGPADAKKKKPKKPAAAKTVKDKRAAALKLATKSVNSVKVRPANPNPAGYSNGIGLTTQIKATRTYKDLAIQVRFLDKAKRVPANQAWRKNRYNIVNKLSGRANRSVMVRTKQRYALSQKAINEKREAQVAKAAQEYQESVRKARAGFAAKRNSIAEFRKNRAKKIAGWANKKKKRLAKKMKAATSSAQKDKVIRLRQAVRTKRRAMHSKNAFRYSIKLSAATSNRQNSLSNASSALSSRVQQIESNAAKMTDKDENYISMQQTKEAQAVANLRQRAINRITGLPFPKKSVKK